MKKIQGGVCAAKGFKANGVHCGIRHNRTKRDLALIVSDVPATAAAVYTQNLVKGAPLTVTKQNIANGMAQAVICNSGNANTCNANGIEIAQGMCALVEQHTGISAGDVVVASTGVIGQPLDLAPIKNGMSALTEGLSQENGSAAAEAIMTTDTAIKELAVSFSLDGKECRMGGIAKGSGMIHPNMATMLVFITTDAAISPQMLQKALSTDITKTFNMLSIDGDFGVTGMPCTAVGQSIYRIHFLGGQRLLGRILYYKLLSVGFSQSLCSERIAVAVLKLKAFRIGALVGFQLFIRRKQDRGKAFVQGLGFVYRTVYVCDILHIHTGIKGVSDLYDALFAHAVHQKISLRVQKDRALQTL